PLDCEYLQGARKHEFEREAPVDPESLPNRDVEISREFLREHEALFEYLGTHTAVAALENPGVVDSDVREALDALIRTYRTMDSGLYYETRPQNPLAGGVFGAIQDGVESFRQTERRELGMAKTRDSDVLRMLVFLRHVAEGRNNGRPRGRAFIDALRRMGGSAEGPEPAESPLILP
ncbi:MAG: hypothetical protein LAQ30_26705, partial [Acidobacteriia bacterium]|nr:hypothetical protein [Terriglobia bacterium]